LTTYIYIGPWEWRDKGDGFGWHPPEGTIGCIDLRPWDACATREIASGYGLFVTDRPLDSSYYLLASDLDDGLKPAARSALVDALALPALSASTSREAIIEILLQRADPDQGSMVGPLVPRHDRMWDMILHPWGRIWQQRFSGTSDVGWPTLQARLQRDYRNLHRFCHTAADKAAALTELQAPDAKVDAIGHMVYRQVAALTTTSILDWAAAKAKVAADYRVLYLKKLDYDSAKLGVNPRLLVPGDLPYEGTVPHDSGYSDDFNRGDNNAMGLSWNEVVGDWDIENQECKLGSTGALSGLRWDQALSTDDHECGWDFATANGGGNSLILGPSTRFTADAEVTCYSFLGYLQAGAGRLKKCIDSVTTQLGGDVAWTPSLPDAFTTQSSGTTHKGYLNSVEKISQTDATISGNLYCGAMGYLSPGNVGRGDNWSCADLGAPPAGNPHYYYQLLRKRRAS